MALADMMMRTAEMPSRIVQQYQQGQNLALAQAGQRRENELGQLKLGQLRKDAQTQSTLQALRQRAMSGDKGALEQMAGLDPEGTGKFVDTQGKMAEQEAAAEQQAALQLARFIAPINSAEQWDAAVKQLEAANVTIPEEFRTFSPETKKRAFMQLMDASGLLKDQGYGQDPLKASDLVQVDRGGGVSEYQTATQAVGQPAFVKPPSSQVTVNQGQESKFSEKLGGALGERAAGIYESEAKAQAQLDRIDQARAMVDLWEQAGGDLGALSGAFATGSALLQSVGVDPSSLGLPADAGPAQAITALSNEMALGKIGGEDGMPANNFSNTDLAFVKNTVQQLTNTASGFAAKLLIQQKMSERAQEKASMWSTYPQTAEGYRKFMRDWEKYRKENPVFTEEDKQQIMAVSGGKSGGGQAAPDPARPIAVDGAGNKVQYNPESGQWEPVK